MEIYKISLFEQADVLFIEAREAYEVGMTETGADLEYQFNALLQKLMSLGWDKEYMGI